MKYFKEHIDEISPLFNDNDNYIIFNDGKPIREHFVDDELVDIEMDDSLDPDDICKIKRNKEEDEIIKKSHFTCYLRIHDDIDLKLFHLNDDETYTTYSIEIESKANVNIYDICGNVSRETYSVTEILANSKSTVNYFYFSRCENKIDNHFNCYVDEKAKVNLNNLMINLNEYKLTSNVYIFDKYSTVNLSNAIINSTGFTQEYNYNVSHLEKNSISSMYNNAICKNASIINLNTDGIIVKDASGTDVKQKSKGIILDELSNIMANPILEIDEYDCLASHGASIGAIDENDLFYLMSRGLPKDVSETLIINSYVNPLLKSINDEAILKYVTSFIEKALK